MKKSYLVLSIIILVLLAALEVHALSKYDLRYSVKKSGYTMKYDLVGAKSISAGAATSSDGAVDVIAFVGIFSYKNNTAKNSTTGQEVGYIQRELSSNGGNRFVSKHNLKDDSYVPIGSILTLELK